MNKKTGLYYTISYSLSVVLDHKQAHQLNINIYKSVNIQIIKPFKSMLVKLIIIEGYGQFTDYLFILQDVVSQFDYNAQYKKITT